MTDRPRLRSNVVVDLFDELESKAVWKIEELADILNVSAKTLYKQAACGKLPSFRLVGASGCTARASLTTFVARWKK
jgi:D-Tyr-tRNAtyr deacylase